MPRRAKTILVVELDLELADLDRVILSDAGYQVITTVCGPSSFQEAQRINPDAIVLDLGMRSRSCGWDLLAGLRADPDTQGIPLLVISDTQPLLNQAKQNFNVRQEIIKPFDIEDLEKGIKAALSDTPLLPHPAPAPTTDAVQVAAANALAHRSDKLMAKWLERVRAKHLLESPAHVPVHLLVNNASVWIVGLISTMRYGSGKIAGRRNIRTLLVEHIKRSREYGATLVQVIAQFEVMRDEVWRELEDAHLQQLTTKDVFLLSRVVNDALDSMTVEIARVYAVRHRARH